MSTFVRDARAQGRFEIVVDDVIAGFAEYRMTDGRIVFTHTQIDDSHEGEGLGSTLVRSALDQTRAAGSEVAPLCPFVASYIERHPEYADLVDEGLTARLEG